jgi:hypothetical protein
MHKDIDRIPGRPADGKFINRPQEQVDSILNRTGDTIILDNFISDQDIDILLEIYNNGTGKDYKNIGWENDLRTGPTTLIVREFKEDTRFIEVFDRIQNKLGINLKIWGGNFFETTKPYIIHNDVDFRHDRIPGKCLVIPLVKNYNSDKYKASNDDAKFYIFDQMFFHGAVKCFKNSKDIVSPYNVPLYDYKDIHGIHSDNRIPDIDAGHMKQEWLEGFSIESACNWVPGDVIVFDCVRLHCASNFLDHGIESKIGLSLFTSYT